MVRRVLCVLMFLLALGLPAAALAEGQTGTITGTVSNATPGGGSVAGLTVTLGRYSGMDLQQQYTATTDQAGKYSFKDLPITDGEAYIVHVSYQNVDYNGSMIQLTQTPQASSDVKVYETTTDGSKVALTSRGVVIAGADPGSRLIEMLEILSIDNTGDHTYLGTNGSVLRIGLPDGAAQIEPQPGFDFGDARMDQGTLVTTGAIPPGNSTALLAYGVPYRGTSATLTIPSAMPTGTLQVLVQVNSFTINSLGMNDNGTVNVSEVNYHVLSVDRPIVGDSVTVQVTGLPKAVASGNSTHGPLYAAIAAIAGLLVAAALIFQLLRRHRATSPKLALAGVPVEPEDERLSLAATLNVLDQERAAGRIDEADYQARRNEVVGQLKAMTLRLRGLEEAED
ncbi:MAG TPA: carboxypeptidase-like regulatory domain-containing protein [Thermomicrobiaceae bacterium]|nr:carboxypeptidase-like regulatory domain-containing protein [Thermomicrobiaceae bacterium]